MKDGCQETFTALDRLAVIASKHSGILLYLALLPLGYVAVRIAIETNPDRIELARFAIVGIGITGLFIFLRFLPPSRRKPSTDSSDEASLSPMAQRIQTYQRELTGWIFHHSEEARFRLLGEKSALVVHDLSGPLHTIQFCATQIQEDPERARDPRYLDQLCESVTRSIELVNSIKEYLKHPSEQNPTTAFADAYESAARIVSISMHGSNFRRIRFDVDQKLFNREVGMARPDLIHVLLNLLANSAENLLKNKVADPAISLSLAPSSEDRISIFIRDNGTGLTLENFEAFTSLSIPSDGRPFSRQGMGLRLIRRLVESYRGKLEVLELPLPASGTLFKIDLPVSSQTTQ